MPKKLYLAILISCNISAGAVSSQPHAAFVVPSGSGLKLCPPNMPKPTAVVRIAIPNEFTSADGDRYVKYKVYATPDDTDKNDDESEYRNSTPTMSNDQEFKDNPFHIDLLATLGHATSANYVKVKVFARDDRYAFLTDSTANPPIQGVMTRSPVSYMCQESKAINPSLKGNRDVLTFYIQRNTIASAQFNIILIADRKKAAGGYDTPIIVDPKVKDDGTQTNRPW